MSNRDFSPHQQKIIKRFYQNRDQTDDQRLAELVTELYLAMGTSKKTDKLWKSAEEIMLRLGVPETRIEHVLKQGKADILALVVQDLQQGKIKRKKSTEKIIKPEADDD